MREELLKECAEEALKNGPHRFIRPDDKVFYVDGFKDGYNLGLKAKINMTTISDAPTLPGEEIAEPREKQIQIDAEQIRALQKQNGELTDRVKELEAQIEKMKWHKIADGDIPKVTGDYITNIGVLTYDHYGNNIYKWHTPFCEACDYGDEVDDDEVIAWCEIPKYTKEIKEK